MKKNTYSFMALIALVIIFSISNSCKTSSEKVEDEKAENLSFESRQIADTVRFLWARCIADVTGDGIKDVVFSENNAYGGVLGYYEGKKDSGLWEMTLINDEVRDEMVFASGDIECADIDFDGDIDVVAARHPGEWKDAGAPSQLYWYENPGWTEHYIGEAPDFVKDMNLADFNNDKKMDLAIITFEESSLKVFKQTEKENWSEVMSLMNYKNIHEGMDVGDVDGDGLIDIVADGYIFYNPGGDLKGEWKDENLDEKWNNQEGDWSRNATKVFVNDVNNDGKSEIFMSHSEREGYPVSYYQKLEDNWNEVIIKDSLTACHTLQVFDFDLDGDSDVLAGMNKGRAAGIGYDEYEVFIFLSENDYAEWKPVLLDENGIYNGQVEDYDGDGDYDIFRYYSHDGSEFYLMENKLRD